MSAAFQPLNVPAGLAIIDEAVYNEFLKGISITDRPIGEQTAEMCADDLMAIGLYPADQVADIDGLLVDSESGEILGVRPPAELSSDELRLAEWAMSRIQQSEASAQAVEQTQLVIQARAILANAERLKAEHNRTSEYIRWKYFGVLKEVAQKNLPKGKKTWQTLHGSVAFRSTPEKVSVGDSEKAANWLLGIDPGAVRIKVNLDQLNYLADLRGKLVASVLEAKLYAPDAVEIDPMVSKLGAATRAILLSIEERKVQTGPDGKPITMIGSTGLAFTAASESVTISTGVARP